MKTGDQTPWGVADYVREISEGIYQVQTPTYGGIKLDNTKQDQTPVYMRRAGGWYEENKDWCLAVLAHQNSFGTETKNHALQVLEKYHPEVYEQFTGNKPKENPQLLKEAKLVTAPECKIPEILIAVEAYSPAGKGKIPEGYVGIVARPIESREDEHTNRYFILPAASYEGFESAVFDPSQWEEVTNLQ